MSEELELQEEIEIPKKKKEEEKPANTGAVLFAALAILLLAFFILLVSMAKIDSNKRRSALSSVEEAFGILKGGLSPLGGPSISQGAPEMERKRFESSMSLFKEYIHSKGFEKEVSVRGHSKGFTISLQSGLLFEKGKAELKGKSFPILDTVKFIIADGQRRFRVRVEGHTDDEPIHTERFPSNWELSVARSISVLRYFLGDSGIREEDLEAAGHAEYQPVAPNDTPENRARNRRVDIVFITKEERKILNPKEAIDIGGFQFTF